jgi:hypothetical protein
LLFAAQSKLISPMASIYDIQKSANDGSLDKASLPALRGYRQVLDGLVNADRIIQPMRETLSRRVADLIQVRERQELADTNAESERKRHEEKLALDRQAVEISKEALAASKKANEISADSNAISQDSNLISKDANRLSKCAIWIAGLALTCSILQLFGCWKNKQNTSSQSRSTEPAKLGQKEQQQPGPALQPSNSTSSMSTNRTPTRMPSTSAPRG